MTTDEAIALLSGCNREELRDHAFGDCEVYWMRGEKEIAAGYFGGETSEVAIPNLPAETPGTIYFRGADAERMRNCGTIGGIERNDSTGPADYREGRAMPGLTSDAVLEEITKPTCKDGGEHDWHERGDYEDSEGNYTDRFYRCLTCRITRAPCSECDGPEGDGKNCATRAKEQAR